MRKRTLIDFDEISAGCIPENLTREKVIEVETEIKGFYNCHDDFVDIKPLSEKDKETLATLFYKRRYILNSLFEETPENLKRLQKVSNHLRFLSAKMFDRVKAMKEKIGLICDDPDFDDDYEIEGAISFHYNEEDSVLSFPDDSFYGSDFRFMMQALEQYNSDYSHFESFIKIRPGNDNLDEKLNWNIVPLKFPDLEICYAAHCICDHYDYSIPDLIRMNDFWTEIKFIEQSITDQTGKRFSRLHTETT